MTIILQPKTTVNIVGANTVVENAAQKILFVGQKTSAGSATGGALDQNIALNAETGLYGADSMLAAMIRSARKLNKINQFDAISLADAGGGTAATGTVVVSGTATAAGTLTVTTGSKINHSFDVAVASGDTATEVGDAIETAVNADANVPVTASNSTGTVTMTAVNVGTMGNFIGLSVEGTVASITTSTTVMASGATDPTLTSVFDVIGDTRYQAIVWPYFADTSVLRTLLDARFNVDNRVLNGMGFTASQDTLANHLTRLNALNSETLVDFTDKTTNETNYKGPAQLELPYVKASQFAAIRALRLTEGASIADLVISSTGALDSFGGAALASKPYFNTPMSLLPLVGVGRGWTDTEIEQLFDAGGSVIGNNNSGNASITGELVTTYKTDAAGNPDISFKFLNYVDTASGAREYFFNNSRSRFAQSRLTEGDVIKGRDQANALVIQAFFEKLYQDLSGPDFVLLEAGEDATVFFKENIVITIDKALGKATVQMTVPLVTQLREILATMQIAFSVGG